MRVTDATTVLQKNIRRFNCALIFDAMEIQHRAVVALQSVIRMRLAENERTRLKASTALQTYIRGSTYAFPVLGQGLLPLLLIQMLSRERNAFEGLRTAIIQVQSRYRSRKPKAELKQLRVESRQLSNVLGKTKQLEDRILALQVRPTMTSEIDS